MARSITVALELDDSGFKRGIKQSQSQADGLKSSIGGVSNALKGFVAAAAGGFAIKGIVETTAKMQDLEGAFNTLFASQEQASAKFDEVGQLATKLGTDADTMREAFVLLKANGIEPTTEMLTAFVDMSKNSTEQLGALEAAAVVFSRSINEGAVSLEELDKIADRGVPVYRMLGEQLGITRGELLEFSKEGDNTKKILDALITSFQQEFGGTAARELETISSQMFVLQNVTDEAKKAIGEGFAPALANLTTELAAAIQANQELLAEMGKLIGEGLSWMLNNLDKIVVSVKAFAAAWAVIKFAELVKGIAALRTGIIAMNAALLANPIGLVVGAIAAATAVIVIYWDEIAGAAVTAWNYTQQAWFKFKELFYTYVAMPIAEVIDWFIMLGNKAEAIAVAIGAAFKAALSLEDPKAAFVAALSDMESESTQFADRVSAKIAEIKKEQEDFRVEIENTTEATEELTEAEKESERAINALSEGTADATSKATKFATSCGQLETALNNATDATEENTDATDENTASTAENTAEQKKNERERLKAIRTLERQKERINDVTGAFEDSAKAQVDRLENERELLDYFGEERVVQGELNQLRNEYQRTEDRLNRLKEQGLITQDQFNDALAEANAQYEQSKIKVEEQARANYEYARSFEYGFKEAFNKFKEDSTNAATLAGDLFEGAARDWRNAWVEASETGDLSFKTLLDNMKKRIVMFLADAAFIKLTETLADAFGINISGKTAGSGGGGSSSGGGSKGGGLGGLIDKGVDFVKGLFGFSEGGYVAGNKSVIVGERGPEIFTPASSGTIIPNFAGMGGGGTQVTYNINAVDSASFVEMLSEQPEIIHSLVMDQDSRMFSRRL